MSQNFHFLSLSLRNSGEPVHFLNCLCGPLLDVVALADQRKAVSDRQKFAAALDSITVEPLGKNATDCRNEGCTSGQEYLVDMGRRGLRLFEHIIKRAFDTCQIAGNPAFEVGTADSLVAAAPKRCKVERRFVCR